MVCARPSKYQSFLGHFIRCASPESALLSLSFLSQWGLDYVLEEQGEWSGSSRACEFLFLLNRSGYNLSQMHGVARGLEFMHSRDVIHADLRGVRHTYILTRLTRTLMLFWGSKVQYPYQ